MSTFFRAAAVAVGGSAVALALASPASAYGELDISAELFEECGGVVLTYTNPTIHPYSGDHRVGEEAGTPDDHSDITAVEGPWEGLRLGDRYNPVAIPAGESVQVQVEVDEDTTVEYWVNRGPEQKAWVAKESIEVLACEDDSDSGEGGEDEPGEGGEDGPGEGGETEPGQGGETDPGEGGQTDPGKGDEPEPGKGDEPAPEKGDKGGDAEPVKGEAAPEGQTLPVTGGALAGLVAAAVAATGAGAGGLWFARKRRVTAEGDE